MRTRSSPPARIGAIVGSVVMLNWLLLLAAGCGKNPVDAALDSDANGYLCKACKARFYTEREVFANHCPGCKSPQISQVVGFVCPDDKHVTIAPRGIGSLACEQCGKVSSGLSIPREKDFQAWGASKQSGADVGS